VSVWDSITGGIAELLAHKLRSFLTMLGVIFGVAAVIAMVSIGEGGRQEALDQLKLLGVDVVRVERKTLSGQALEKAQEVSPYGLNYGDVEAIKSVVNYAQSVVPVRQVMGELLVKGPPVAAKILGTTAPFLDASRSSMAAGRFLSEEDVDESSRVCVLGSGVKRRLFGFENPVNKTIVLSGDPFTVVGVLAPKTVPGKMVVDVPDQNFDIYIPLSVSIRNYRVYSEQPTPSTMAGVYRLFRALRTREKLDDSPISSVIIQTGSEAASVPTAEIVGSVLKRRHRGIDDYTIEVPSELIRQSQETQRVFNIVMGAIAGISLLVGGIGIMNIMLATVTQRTREIGIRRCVGATRMDITKQFLLEALVITLLGGLMGVALGVGSARAISEYAGWKTIVNTQAIALSLGVACGVGVIFGIYPAARAAMVDPITALRYE